MSTTVDQRVVEMRFDNKQFESGVSSTMSILDKLKQSLNFKGATNGFSEIQSASNKVNMSGLGSAVETVHAKFSALEVMGVTALANITNSAVNAGKKMISALTIDPITTGFQEYETQINAVQTILANTKSKGSTIDDVNKALEELNLYADKTIYNFTEMTRNIGTFTAAGVDLKTSTSAIQGIANLAAISGSNSQQAATAMYQLSQALAAGSVKLMDWNSVVNAGMGGEVFQNALKDTAREFGDIYSISAGVSGNIDDLIDTYGSFRESLKEGWITSEVLTKTLSKFTTSGVNEYIAEGTGLTVDAVAKMREQALASDDITAAYKEMAKSLAKNSSLTEDEIFNMLDMSTTAEDAATKVKTFTQLWDVLKESAQSGWSQTWKIIVGDFEEAKSLLTPLADFLTGAINSFSNARNFLLEGALDLASPWGAIMDKIDAAGLGKIKDIAESVGEVTDKLKHFQDVVNEVWLGKWNNSDTGRFEMLEAAGYDHRVVQDLVNKGYQYKLTMEDVEASHKKFGLTLDTTSESAKSTTDILASLSDEQLRNAGLTDDEIRLYRDLAAEAEKTGQSMSELIDEMSKNDGRTMLIDSFKNAGKGLVTIFAAVKDAWVEIFPPMSVVTLYNIIKGIKEFSEHLVVGDETADKLKRTFEGLFAIIDIVATLTGGAFKIAFQVVSEVLKYFNLDILDFTAGIAEGIIGFRDWIDSVLDVSGAIEFILPYIEKGITAIKDWYESFKESGVFDDFKERLVSAKDAVIDWFTGLKDMSPREIAESIVNGIGSAIKYIGELFGSLKGLVMEKINDVPDGVISGFIEGLKNGAAKIGEVMLEIGKILVEKIKSFLGIHSPSTVFFAIGGFIVAGLVGGLLAGAGDVGTTITSLVSKAIETVSNINFGAIFAGAIGAGVVGIGWKLASAIQSFASPFEAVGDILENLGDVVKSFDGILDAFAGKIKAEATAIRASAIKDIAIAIALIAGSIALLTLVDPAKALAATVLLAAVVAALIVLVNQMGKIGITGTIKVGQFVGLILGISIAMGALAVVGKIISTMDWDEMSRAGAGLAGLVGIITLIMLISKIGNADKAGKGLLGMAIAMGALVLIGKMLAGMEWDELAKAGAGMLGLIGVITLLTLVTKIGNGNKLGSTLIGIAAAMAALTLIGKAIASMEWEDIGKAGVGMLGLVGIVALLTSITKIKGTEKVGATLLGLSASLAILVVVGKLIATMEWEDMAKAGIAITALGGIIAGLIAATKLAGANGMKGVGINLILLSVAIGILAGVAALLGTLSVEQLTKGVTVVAILGGIMAGLIAVTKYAQDCNKNLLMITIAIGVLAISVAALSKIDGSELAGATIALGALMIIFAGLIAVTKFATGSVGPLITMTVAIGVLAGAIALLSLIDTSKAIEASIALSLLIASMTIALAGLTIIGKHATNAYSGVLALTLLAVPLAAFVGAIALLSGVSDAAENMLALTLFVSVLTVVLGGLTVIGSFATKAYSGVVALALLAVPLLAFIGELALMDNIQNADENAKILSTFVATMTVVLGALTVIGAFAIAAVSGVGALALLAVPMVAFIGEIALLNCVPNAQANADLLSGFMTTMADVLVKVGIVAPLALIGVGAITALSAVMVALGALAVGVGALMTQFPQLQDFLNNGIPVLEQLATAVGTFLGNIVGGFIESVGASISTTLPMIGTGLSLFMTNAAGFIAGAKTVDESVLIGIGILTGAILALTAADLIAGIASFIQGGSSFAQLGMELSMFMLNATPFIMGASMLNEGMMSGVKAIAETILILTAADVLNGLTSWFTGGSSLSSFGAQLPQLGSDLSSFATNLGTFDESKVATVTAATNAIKAIADVAQNLPNEGGWLAKLVGDNSIGAFGSQLSELGKHISSFASNLGTFDEAKVTTIKCAADAIKAVADVAQNLPNEGGWAAKIFGDNSISTFGSKLPSLATNLNNFAANLGTFDEAKVTTVGCAANAIKVLAEAADQIPNEGGWAAKIFGDNSISTFGDKLPTLGTNLSSFATNLGTFTDDQVSTVQCAANAIKVMAQAASNIDGQPDWAKKIFGDNSLASFGGELETLGTNLSNFAGNLGTFDKAKVATVQCAIDAVKAFTGLADADLQGAKKNLSGFGDKIVEFAKDMSSFCTGMPSGDNISSAIKNIDKVLDAIDKIAAVDTSVAADFTDALKKIGKDGVKNFVEAFTSSAAKKDVKKAAKDLMEEAVDGIETKEDDLKKAFSDAAKNTADKADDYHDDFYDAGSYMVDGFAAGISENDYKAAAKAKAMAKAAKEAAEEELGIESPSKVFYGIGRFTGMGFINALDDFARASYKAGADMATASRDGLRDTLNKASEIFGSDIDVTPTIRPVLDLSEVKSGASSIGSMLNLNPSVGVSSNISAINSMMNRRVQNGSNDDVVSAINKLRDNIDNLENKSYTINGITYGDDSEIADAVRTLVRAAKVDRRT